MTALHRAFSEAIKLGHQWVGPDHIILAVLNGPTDSVARRALEGLGLSYGTYQDQLQSSLLDNEPPVRSDLTKGEGAHPAPIYYNVVGWTNGFGSAHGTAAADETVLLAICWIMEGAFCRGVSRRSVADQLHAHGVALPRTELPPDLTLGQRVDIPPDQLNEVRSALMDAGLLLGFNIDSENEQAWVAVETMDDDALELIASTLRSNG